MQTAATELHPTGLGGVGKLPQKPELCLLQHTKHLHLLTLIVYFTSVILITPITLSSFIASSYHFALKAVVEYM